MLFTPADMKREGGCDLSFCVIEWADKGLSQVFREGFKTCEAARVGKGDSGTVGEEKREEGRNLRY